MNDDLPSQVLLHDRAICLSHHLQGFVVLQSIIRTKHVGMKGPDDWVFLGTRDLRKGSGIKTIFKMIHLPSFAKHETKFWREF